MNKRPPICDRRSNHMDSAQRSAAARKGRGENAFTPKEAAWWRKAQARIEEIALREHRAQMAGNGCDVIRFWKHVYKVTLVAKKF